MQISRLETRFGTRLLERSSRPVALTREGADILPRVQSLLAEARHLLESASEAKATPRGPVRIAVTPALGSLVLERLVPVLAERYPDITLIVIPSYGFDDMQDPAFDFAIRIGKVADEALVAQKVGRFSRVLVCAPGHPAAQARSIRDLDDLPLLASSGQTNEVRWHLEKAGSPDTRIVIERDARVVVLDFEMLCRLARQSNGVAMIPEFMVSQDLAEKRLVRVLPEWQSPPLDVLLAYRVGMTQISRVARVIDLARTAIADVLSQDK
jgi:DNA-binding transcriptional LysR family regulator